MIPHSTYSKNFFASHREINVYFWWTKKSKWQATNQYFVKRFFLETDLRFSSPFQNFMPDIWALPRRRFLLLPFKAQLCLEKTFSNTKNYSIENLFFAAAQHVEKFDRRKVSYLSKSSIDLSDSYPAFFLPIATTSNKNF